MTKTEESLCNGITFSVPRMVPTAVQEGELDNALYYVIVYLTPQLDKVVMKFYEAPSYKPLQWKGRDIECVTFRMEKLTTSDSDNTFIGYNFGTVNSGMGRVYPDDDSINGNSGLVYNGLMLYSGLKCIIIRTLNNIIIRSK